jgi:ribose-phosphate pyrophosphokinase
VGGIKRVEQFRLALERATGTPVSGAFMEKYRGKGVVSGEALVGEVKDKVVVVIDDLIATGATLLRAATACRRHGARKIHAAATHGVFVGADEALANPALDQIVVTNTIPPFRLVSQAARAKLEVLDAAPLFAAAIDRIHGGGSIVELRDTL